MDPRLARIQAAARMPLPRLAADALADALALAAEVARLRAGLAPAPLPAPQPRKDSEPAKPAVAKDRTKPAPPKPAPPPAEQMHKEMLRLRISARQAVEARDRANEAAKEMSAELEKAKAELEIWRATAGAHVERCRDCGAAVTEGKLCKECAVRRHVERSTKCACGRPKYRPETAMCRTCWLAVAQIPRKARPTAPGTCVDCGVETAPGRTVCSRCSRIRHVAKHAAKCSGCGGPVSDVGTKMCLSCYRKHRFGRKENHDQQT